MKTGTILGGIAAIGFVAQAASAVTVLDLRDPTLSSSGFINGAFFAQGSIQPAGSGVLDSFVRLQSQGNDKSSEGYNTSAPSQNFRYDEVAGNFTHDVQFQDVEQVNVGGIDYLRFILDINEPSGGVSSQLSLDRVNIYTSATGSQTVDENLLGTLRYSMDAGMDSVVLLDFDDYSSGSGATDMTMLVPLANFAGVAATDYLYLYSAFGEYMPKDFLEQDGYEEWKFFSQTAQPPEPPLIPLPSAAGLGLAGLLLASSRRRRLS